MSEFVQRIPRGVQTSVATDPDQTISNATESPVDKPITTRNAIVIGATVNYTKRTLTAAGGALISQTGNARIERELNTGIKGLGFVSLGIAIGEVGLPAIAILGEISVAVVNGLQEMQQITFENERKVSVRGGLTTLKNTYD